MDGKRLARVACLFHGAISRQQRRDDARHQGRNARAGLAGDRVFDFGIGEARGRAHQATHKAVMALSPLRIDDHAHDEAGALLALAQGALVGRKLVRKHWHDAIRKIGRVAALGCFPVKG